MKNKTFEVMITFPHLLEERIIEHNELYKTNFKLVEIIYDEVTFGVIGYNQETESDIFSLGFGLAMKQFTLRDKGEINW